MSFVVLDSEVLVEAAEAVQTIHARVVETNAEATPVMTGVSPPAADAISKKAAAQLKTHAEKYHETIARAAAILDRFANALSTIAAAYSAAEIDNSETVSC